ncbi:META domain-containing protein [Streptomyces sp. NPDC048623]|uniref:META domain-containing protein n=1 Tax=Streptomyces sp. NPDC048623 TaxID=3155761 RepID=UPI003431332F
MKKPRVLAGTVGTALALLLSACGTGQGAGPGGGAGAGTPDLPVAGTHWTIAAVTVDGTRSVAPSGAGLEFKRNGQVGGNSGCNGFTADVAVKGDTLTVSLGPITLIGCPADRERFERALLKAFTGELRGKLQDRGLTLSSVDGRNTLELTAEADAPLVGTAWTVDALLDGGPEGTASSLPAGSEGKARLTFGKDGRLTGTLGCNRVTAPATITAKTITLGAIGTTRMRCTGPEMALETALYERLDGPLTYRLTHRTLIVTDVDGGGFSATAD